MAEYEYGGKNKQTFQKLPGYKKIVAWQAASDLERLVNQLVSRFGPGHYRLANQMRGAAISVSGNIAEGYCSGSLPNYVVPLVPFVPSVPVLEVTSCSKPSPAPFAPPPGWAGRSSPTGPIR